jgi:hypothetical protein
MPYKVTEWVQGSGCGNDETIQVGRDRIPSLGYVR